MICLVGFMGAGKSSALVEFAAQGLETADADDLIKAEIGGPIADYFDEHGEESFRKVEQEIVLRVMADPAIDALALGGGAVESPAIREALNSDAHTVVWLEIPAEVAWRRARKGRRPLARDRNGFGELLARRHPLYMEVADATLPATGRRIWERALGPVRILTELPPGTRMFWAESANGDYPVYVGRGLLGSALFSDPGAALPGEGRSVCITDETVGPLFRDRLGPLAGEIAVPPGESAKTLARAEEVLREMAALGMTRADRVIALGGGVIGDLAGFCAHTYQRGVPVVQVPTTLVAQVDSAYGGKTGVDLPEAKNYVGAYHLPSLVVTDVDALDSLPDSEISAGMAEVVKTALLAGGRIWEQVRDLEPGGITGRADLVYACARYKCSVVAEDERDAGIRAALNLGHTVGHAIEAATSYGRYRHGEAVALGLLAALRLSDLPGLRTEVEEWNRRHGLPVELDPSVGVDSVLAAIEKDKKRTSKGVGFVLLRAPGEPMVDCLVAPDSVRQAVEELIS
ncbi:MAG: bifunctional shikimate kinase/3-dehydroquinate synthase [Thermoleophilia bacterium]|nr:bifunctional shikimate kinase/3-dehydroquinate synthase [Thermoleophilia bacterium]